MTPRLSDHFNGKTFRYPGETRDTGLWDVIRWKMTSQAKPWKPVTPDPVRTPPERPESGFVVSWIGHSTFLIQTPTLTFLTDPVFSRRASPVAWLGPERAIPPAMTIESLPPVDVVLLSHDHYDHCDVASLKALGARHHPRLFAPLGHQDIVKGFGFKEIHMMDWWESLELDGARITLTPSRHWCRRWPWDTNRRLWGGFMVGLTGSNLYFLGDSGYDPQLFKDIGKRLGSPDLALIPIGAYEPRWFMERAHMNPSEAVLVHKDINSKTSIGMHWGTFQLTDEDREDPVRHLEEACRQAGLEPDAFRVLPPGGSYQG